MANVTEYLKQIQALTNKNLEMLNAINQSFYTKKTKLTVNVAQDTQYTIPSFLALESRLQSLEDNFENLVNAPKTGVAAFNFDGTTQEIQVKSFANVPEALKISASGIKNFDIKQNNIFKDMVSPAPYIKMDLADLPDDILSVAITKYVFKSEEIKEIVSNRLGENVAIDITLDIVQDIIYPFVAEKDYQVYTTITNVPVRDNGFTGTYTINTINSDELDENFEEYYDVVVDEPLVYTDRNGEENQIAIGDYLLCNDGKIKLEVTEVYPESKRLVFKVLNGGYADLTTSANGETVLSKLTYFSESNFLSFKYINVPLEEDQYIVVFIDTINKLNVMSNGTSGVLINTYDLLMGKEKYESYYKNVNNIGDKIESLTAMYVNGVNVYTGEQFDKLTTGIVPSTSDFLLEVKQINSHLNNSETVKEIRSLYSQKSSNKILLENINKEITKLNQLINEVDYNDTTGSREVYQQQLVDKQAEYQKLREQIKTVTEQIAEVANNSVIPIENAKYHIRGFFDTTAIKEQASGVDSKYPVDVIKLEVWYRYRNLEGTAGNAMTIGDTKVFSDWNIMSVPVRTKLANYNSETASYTYSYSDLNDDKNEPSFNQIDIPISQGEVVDMQIRAIYDLGYPYIEVRSQFSEILTVEFPEELRKDIEILDIVNENNDEVKKFAFDNILTKYGVQDHTNDKVQDNDTTFWHHADYVTSGFYTEEQRVISLKEKLVDLTNKLTEVRDDVYGTNTNDVVVVMRNSEHSIVLNDNAENTFVVQDFKSNQNVKDTKKADEQRITFYSYSDGDRFAELDEKNGTYTMKLYGPGSFGSELCSTSKAIAKDTGRVIYKEVKFVFPTAFKVTYTNSGGSSTSVTIANNDLKIAGILCTDDDDWATIGKFDYIEYILDVSDPDTLVTAKTILNNHSNAMLLNGEKGFDVTLSYKLGEDVETRFDRVSIEITNTTDKTMKLYPLFYGSSSTDLIGGVTQLTSSEYFVGRKIFDTIANTEINQKYNQVLYFRSIDPYTRKALNWSSTNIKSYPYTSNIEDILLKSNNAKYITVNSNETVQVGIMVEYSLDETENNDKTTAELAFDVRTSLYQDPHIYKVILKANYETTSQFESENKNRYDTVIIN